LTCLQCRRARKIDHRPPIADGWNCVICGDYVKRTKGPTGLYCQAHKGTRNRLPKPCKGCGGKFIASTGRIYCSDDCKPIKQAKEPPARFTVLDWKTCPCGRWICKQGRKYCSAACSREFTAINLGRRNRTCRQCEAQLGYFSRKHLCDSCQLANKRHRRVRERRDPNRSALNNHRQRARHYGVDYEPVKRSQVYERDGWLCGICRKKVDHRLRYPHLMSASIDHVIPMALGGGHTYLNVQCSHLICNSRKSHHGSGDQLALIG
jgi:hypothetical protein